MNTQFQPNEYEQQLIAAGMIQTEQIDGEYQEYLKTTRHHEEQMSYSEWQECLGRLALLNAEYNEKIEPFYKQDGELPYDKRVLEGHLMAEMNYCEMALGY